MKNNTSNKKEIEKFSRIAEEWWDPEGKFKPLHKFNPIRISYIKENIINSFKLNIASSTVINILVVFFKPRQNFLKHKELDQVGQLVNVASS